MLYTRLFLQPNDEFRLPYWTLIYYKRDYIIKDKFDLTNLKIYFNMSLSKLKSAKKTEGCLWQF